MARQSAKAKAEAAAAHCDSRAELWRGKANDLPRTDDDVQPLLERAAAFEDQATEYRAGR